MARDVVGHILIHKGLHVVKLFQAKQLEVGAIQILADFKLALEECLHGFLERSLEDAIGARLPIRCG